MDLSYVPWSHGGDHFAAIMGFHSLPRVAGGRILFHRDQMDFVLFTTSRRDGVSTFLVPIVQEIWKGSGTHVTVHLFAPGGGLVRPVRVGAGGIARPGLLALQNEYHQSAHGAGTAAGQRASHKEW